MVLITHNAQYSSTQCSNTQDPTPEPHVPSVLHTVVITESGAMEAETTLEYAGVKRLLDQGQDPVKRAYESFSN